MMPFGPLDWLFASRYIRAKRQDSYISVVSVISFLGIALGVATLVVVMAVMTGFRADLLDRILGVNGHARIENIGHRFKDINATVADIRQLPAISYARPMIDAQVMASFDRDVRGQIVRGFPVSDIMNLPALQKHPVTGDLSALDQPRTVAIGRALADRFGLAVGDRLSLIAPRGEVTPFGTTPRMAAYRIVAIFEVGLSDYDLNVMFMSYDHVAQLIGRDPATGVIEIDTDDPDQIDETAQRVLQALGTDYRIVTWRQSNATLAGALEVERNVMLIILTLILLIAALNIISGMVMLVREKGRDIAILRAMGAEPGFILRIFFITGASIGVVASFVGLGLGALFCSYIEEIRQFLIWITGADLFPAQIYFLEKLPARMVWSDVMQVMTMSLLLSFLSTLYPAWRATRLEPAEALRYE